MPIVGGLDIHRSRSPSTTSTPRPGRYAAGRSPRPTGRTCGPGWPGSTAAGTLRSRWRGAPDGGTWPAYGLGAADPRGAVPPGRPGAGRGRAAHRAGRGRAAGRSSRAPAGGRAAAGRHRPGGDRRAGGPAAPGAAPAERRGPAPGRGQGAGRPAVRGRAGHRAGDHLLAGRGRPVLLLPPGGPVRRAGASPCTRRTARARPESCPGRARRCCAGRSTRPARHTPAPPLPTTATTPRSRTARTASAPACPRPARSSARPITSWPSSATTRSPLPDTPHPSPWRPARDRRPGRAGAAGLTEGDHRGQLPPIRCQPLPARTGPGGRPDQTERPHPRRPGTPNQSSCHRAAQAPRAKVRLAAPGPAPGRHGSTSPAQNGRRPGPLTPLPTRLPALPPAMIRSRADASRAPTAPLRGRFAPPDPPARSQDPAAIRTGSRLSHPQTTVTTAVKSQK
jgi:hypothetical protein